MARIRTIKPEFWSDATISELTIFTTLFYIGLWNFADDAGRGRARAKELNGLLFGGRDDVEESQIETALQELASSGRIILYSDNGIRLFQIVKWWQHQKIDKPTPSRFSAPEGFSEPISKATGDTSDTSTNIRRELPEASPKPSGPDNGRRKTEDGNGTLELGNGKTDGRTQEGGVGETAAPIPTEPEQVSVRPSVSLEQAPFPSVPEPAQQKPSAPPPNRPPEWRLSEADVKSLLKDGWTRQEIDWGVEIGIECGTRPRSAKSVLHASILPEVREGARPARLLPPPLPSEHSPPKPPGASPEEKERLRIAMEQDVERMKRAGEKLQRERGGTSDAT